MPEPIEKKVTFKITLTVTDPAAIRAEALRLWLSRGGTEADFTENEQSEDAVADTPVGAWILALFNHPRDYGPGCTVQSHEVDTCKFYQPPPLPKGFDAATSVSGVQIAKLMTVALESYWSDIEPVLPERFRSLVTNPVWYSDPALYESQQPWYFEFPNRQYAGYDAAKNEALFEDFLHKICRADIIAALASLAENRPRRIVEIMNGNSHVDLADIFFQTVVFKDHSY